MSAPACAENWVDPGWWFSGRLLERRLAMSVCAGCPIAGHCLELAMRAEGDLPARYRYGIYAGTTSQQRWRIARGLSPWPADLTDPLLTSGAERTSADSRRSAS